MVDVHIARRYERGPPLAAHIDVRAGIEQNPGDPRLVALNRSPQRRRRALFVDRGARADQALRHLLRVAAGVRSDLLEGCGPRLDGLVAVAWVRASREQPIDDREVAVLRRIHESAHAVDDGVWIRAVGQADLNDLVVAGIGGVEELLVDVRQALVRRARLAAVVFCEKVHLRLVGRRPL